MYQFIPDIGDCSFQPIIMSHRLKYVPALPKVSLI